MGLFTSNCPHCNGPINWFLDAPKDFVCACGKHVTPEEIEKSWDDNYFEHIQKVFKNCFRRGDQKGIEEIGAQLQRMKTMRRERYGHE